MLIYRFLCLLFAVLLLSCNHTEVSEERNDEYSDELIADAQINDELLAKAKEFSEALTANKTRSASVYVYNRLTVEHYPNEEGAKKLAARIVLMGYTDVLLSVHPANGQDFAELRNKDWVRVFNQYLRQYNINVHALMFSEASQFDEAKNSEIYQHASVIQQYNRTVSADERLAGASADWEPHTLKINSSLADDANLSYEDRWDTERYGENGANDRLLKRTGEMLKIAKSYLDEMSEMFDIPKIPLNEAINYHFQEQNDRANLIYGNVSTYLQSGRCRDVNVMAYNNKKEEVWRRVQSNLAAADRNNYRESIYICIKTRLGDDEGPGTSLKPQGWDYLIETLNYLHENASAYSSMKGISVYDYSDTEDLWIHSVN